jgi:hypothetical protein
MLLTLLLVLWAEPEVRSTSQVEDEDLAWRSEGLRVELGYGLVWLTGADPVWPALAHAFHLRPELRIDEQWAIGLGASYGLASVSSGPGLGAGGIRWAVDIEPSFTLWRQLALKIGVGWGGLILSDENFERGILLPGTIESGPNAQPSRNLVEGEQLQNCSGMGPVALARIEYLFLIGPLAATGPFAEAGVQWTECSWSFGFNSETGEPVQYTQWWQHRTFSVGWSIAWR